LEKKATMKIGFVHIPKSAGGSILRWARANHANVFVEIGHNSLAEYRKHHYDTTFAVPRNTYRRILSLYNWVDNKIIKILKKFSYKSLEYKTARRQQKYWRRGIVPFCDYIFENPEVRSHHDQLKYIKGVDLLLPYESLAEDFYKIQELFNSTVPLTYTEHSRTSNLHVNELSTDFVKCIKRHFAEELDYFEYEPI
tara:strand:+ start:1210 stop:1797 length:588 start_codon:yes stop_codon:yes gene_type:complete